jgi:hypothetical protein
VNYPRRRQLRLLARAFAGGTATIALLCAAAATARTDGTGSLSVVLLSAAVLCAWRARRDRAAARRNRIGAESEERVARVLAELRAEGWKIRHGVDWPGRGDIDHVAHGRARRYAIETKTARYSRAHLERVHHQARWLGRRRGRRAAAVLVLCGARGVRRYDGEVLIVSVEQLVPALRDLDSGDAVAA